jgi:hypothetical protein
MVSNVFAQETPHSPSAGVSSAATNHPSDLHVGVGVGIETAGFTIVGNNAVPLSSPFGSGAVHLPIDIAGMVRVEPSIGWVHHSQTVASDSVEDSDSQSAIRLGLGAFYRLRLGDSAAANLGVRLGPLFASQKERSVFQDPLTNTTIETNVVTSRTDFSIGPAIGGEYFPSKHFSLGAEIQLNTVLVGDETDDTPPDPAVPESERSELYSYTTGVLFARLFFM